jgi:aspartate 1-decarboxylase
MRTMLKSKIHGATVTDTVLDYEGSITIDAALLEKADILPGERVQVLDLDSGNRLETYTIKGKPNSGIICMNGPSARLVNKGHTIMIISYVVVNDEEAKRLKPSIIFLKKGNKIKKIG